MVCVYSYMCVNICIMRMYVYVLFWWHSFYIVGVNRLVCSIRHQCTVHYCYVHVYSTSVMNIMLCIVLV